MKIAFFTNCYKPLINGVVTSISALREAFEEKGHNTYIFAPKVEDYVDKEENIFRYKSVNLTKKVKYPLAIPLSFKAKKVIKEFNPDIIHIHHPFLLSSIAMMYGRQLGIPRILTIHTQYEQYAYYISPIPSKFTQEAIKIAVSSFASKTDCITTPSESMKELLREYGIVNKIEVIPNAIKIDFFKEKDEAKCREIKEKYHLNDDEKIILFVGRIAAEKSIDKIIKALKIVKESGMGKIRLLIVGDGPDSENLKNLVSSLKLDSDVIFTGAIDYQEIKHYYKLAYLFVIASTTETFGIVNIEALASGLPVLAVRAPGAVDILTDGIDGRLTNNDVLEFARVLAELIQKPDLRDRYSKGAIKTSHRYSIDAISEQMLNLYQENIKSYKNYKKLNLEKKNKLKDFLSME